MIRLIGIDIDGTLMDDYGNIPDCNIDAIKRAYNEYGVKIALCTGRGASAFEIAKILDINCSLILANGVYVYKNLFDKPSIKNYLSYDAKIAILEFLDFNSDDFDYYIVLGYEEDFHMIYKKKDIHHPYFLNFAQGRKSFKPTYPEHDLKDHIKRPISHIGIVGKYDKLRYLKNMLNGLDIPINLILYYASDDKNYGFLEILDINASKEESLLKLAKISNIDNTQILTIGDNFNDIGMIKKSAIGVAVLNAPDEVKRVAHYVTKSSNNEGAVAEVIKMFVFDRKI